MGDSLIRKTISNADDIHEGDIPFTSFDGAHMGAIDSAFCGDGFLRISGSFSIGTNYLAKPFLSVNTYLPSPFYVNQALYSLTLSHCIISLVHNAATKGAACGTLL